MEGAVTDTQAGPWGKPLLQEQEPEACMVTMATTTLHPAAHADSLGFCNWGGSGKVGGGGNAGFGWGSQVCFHFCQIQNLTHFQAVPQLSK